MIYDFAVIGAGMAGASIAAELAPHASVLLLEAETAWSERRTRAVAWRDETGEAVSAVALNDIVRARVELRALERQYGADC